MKRVAYLLVFCLATSIAYGQDIDAQKKKDLAIAEIKNLFKELNEAIQKHDRVALEKIYADEFLFIHGFGYIDTKSDQVNGFMETDSVRALLIPSFDQFYLYGNTAVLRLLSRNPVGGNDLMSTTIYAKNNGKWQIIQVQSTQQQRPRKIIKVDPAILNTYAGVYKLANGSITTITRQGDSLIIQRTGRPKQPVSAISDTQFFDKSGSDIIFFKDASGTVTHFSWRSQNGQESIWTKADN